MVGVGAPLPQAPPASHPAPTPPQHPNPPSALTPPTSSTPAEKSATHPDTRTLDFVTPDHVERPGVPASLCTSKSGPRLQAFIEGVTALCGGAIARSPEEEEEGEEIRIRGDEEGSEDFSFPTSNSAQEGEDARTVEKRKRESPDERFSDSPLPAAI